MNEVMKTLRVAREAGMTVYKVNGHDTFGFIVTPNGNVLTVQKATWGWVKSGELFLHLNTSQTANVVVVAVVWIVMNMISVFTT